MRAHGTAWVTAAIIGLLAGGPVAQALPNPDQPIDPSKRAPISTADAVRPAATPTNGNGVVNGRVIRMAEVPIQRAHVDGDRAPVEVRETRAKEQVTRPTAKRITGRTVEVQRASDRPAAIPRIDRERFHRLLREYENDRMPAAAMIAGELQVGDQRVSLADINRFANPRAPLEAQGIPVVPAGSSEAPPASAEATVPVSREQNGGGGGAPAPTTTTTTATPGSSASR
jgi:hypothetical protein